MCEAPAFIIKNEPLGGDMRNDSRLRIVLITLSTLITLLVALRFWNLAWVLGF